MIFEKFSINLFPAQVNKIENLHVTARSKLRLQSLTLKIVYTVAVSGWLLEYSDTLKIFKPHLFKFSKCLFNLSSCIVSMPNLGKVVKLFVWASLLTPVICGIDTPDFWTVGPTVEEASVAAVSAEAWPWEPWTLDAPSSIFKYGKSNSSCLSEVK